jgi:hypothetical protein
LVYSSDNPSLDLEAVNQWLHSEEVWAPWPDFLVAFASHGCGDYFAFDTRSSPPSVVYIEPHGTPEESLEDPDALLYENFEAWYEHELVDITCSRCGSRDTRFEPSLDREWLLLGLRISRAQASDWRYPSWLMPRSSVSAKHGAATGSDTPTYRARHLTSR